MSPETALHIARTAAQPSVVTPDEIAAAAEVLTAHVPEVRRLVEERRGKRGIVALREYEYEVRYRASELRKFVSSPYIAEHAPADGSVPELTADGWEQPLRARRVSARTQRRWASAGLLLCPASRL